MREKLGSCLETLKPTPGGRALKFYASVRLDVRGNTPNQRDWGPKDTNVGKETKIKVVKNKVAPPFKEAMVEIMYGEGISRTGELVKIATDLDIIQKRVRGTPIMAKKLVKDLKMLRNSWLTTQKFLTKSTTKVRVHFGLIEEDEAVKTLDKTEEAAPVVEEVTLDLDDAIEIED